MKFSDFSNEKYRLNSFSVRIKYQPTVPNFLDSSLEKKVEIRKTTVSVSLSSASEYGTCSALLNDFNSLDSNVPILAFIKNGLAVNFTWNTDEQKWSVISNSVYAGSTKNVTVYYLSEITTA